MWNKDRRESNKRSFLLQQYKECTVIFDEVDYFQYPKNSAVLYSYIKTLTTRWIRNAYRPVPLPDSALPFSEFPVFEYGWTLLRNIVLRERCREHCTNEKDDYQVSKAWFKKSISFQSIRIGNYEILFKYTVSPYARHATKWVITALQPLITPIDPQSVGMLCFTPRIFFILLNVRKYL